MLYFIFDPLPVMISTFEKLAIAYSLACTVHLSNPCFLILQVFYSTKGFLEKNRWCLCCPLQPSENENTVSDLPSSCTAFSQAFTVNLFWWRIWGPFLEIPETFRARKAIAKSLTLRSQSCFIHTFLIWTDVPFKQEVLGAYTAPVLDKDELKMALRAR